MTDATTAACVFMAPEEPELVITVPGCGGYASIPEKAMTDNEFRCLVRQYGTKPQDALGAVDDLDNISLIKVSECIDLDQMTTLIAACARQEIARSVNMMLMETDRVTADILQNLPEQQRPNIIPSSESNALFIAVWAQDKMHALAARPVLTGRKPIVL